MEIATRHSNKVLYYAASHSLVRVKTQGGDRSAQQIGTRRNPGRDTRTWLSVRQFKFRKSEFRFAVVTQITQQPVLGPLHHPRISGELQEHGSFAILARQLFKPIPRHDQVAMPLPVSRPAIRNPGKRRGDLLIEIAPRTLRCWQ